MKSGSIKKQDEAQISKKETSSSANDQNKVRSTFRIAATNRQLAQQEKH